MEHWGDYRTGNIGGVLLNVKDKTDLELQIMILELFEEQEKRRMEKEFEYQKSYTDKMTKGRPIPRL